MAKKDMSYIKLFRKSLDNEIFMEKPFDRWHAFEYLVLKAYKFPKTQVIKGQKYSFEPGQWLCSESKLAETFGWSRGKLRRFLDLLVTLGMINKNGTSGGTLITIENYALYQGVRTANRTTGGTADSTTDGTQNKKVKKDKNVFVPPTVNEVRSYCQERSNKVDAKRFVDFYTSNGWMVGKQKMQDWKAAVRYWESFDKDKEIPEDNNPAYKKFTPEPERQAEPMPDDLRDKIKGAFQ